MKKKEASTELRNMVQSAIDARKAEERISPAWIATEVMAKLGGTELQQSKPLLYVAAHQHVHEIARQACRKQFETDDDALDPAQQEMFPGLQLRYPTAPDGDETGGYVARDSMSEKDIVFNVNRLRREGNNRLLQADALEAWSATQKIGRGGTTKRNMGFRGR